MSVTKFSLICITVVAMLTAFVACTSTPEDKAIKLAKDWVEPKAEANQERNYNRLSMYWMGTAKKQKIQITYDVVMLVDNDIFAIQAQTNCVVDLIVMGQTVEYNNCKTYHLVVNATLGSVVENNNAKEYFEK